MTTSAIERLVQEAAAGRSPWKLACRLVATSNLTLQGLQTVDSVLLQEGDRILLSAQTDPTQNGIRIASDDVWIRAVDFDSNEEATLGMVIKILEGSTGANTEWELTSPTSGVIVIGATALTFQQSGAGGGVSAVHATLPLVSSGGTTPTLTINAATDSTPGSLSASDKTKIDSLDDGTISAFNTGTPTLVAKVGGRVNRLSGTASAPTLPSGPLGASVILENIGLTSLVVHAPSGDTIDGETTYAIPDGDETANPHVRPVVIFYCDVFTGGHYQWTCGAAASPPPPVVTNAADGLAPAQSVTALTASSSTLIADPLGRENTVGPLVTALAIAGATVGAKCRFRFLANGSDVVITPASGTIDGSATATARGSGNSNLSGGLKCLVAGNWVSDGLDSALPSYVAPLASDAISLSHGAASSGTGITDPLWTGQNGALDGGSAVLTVGQTADITNHHDGSVTINLGRSNVNDTKSGSLILAAGTPPTSRLEAYGYNDSGGAGGLHIVGRGVTIDMGTNVGGFNQSGQDQILSFPDSWAVATSTVYWRNGSGTAIEAWTYWTPVVTTNTTPTMIASWGFNANEIDEIECDVLGSDGTNHHSGWFHREGVFETRAGVTTQLGTTDNGGKMDKSNLGGVVVTIDFSGTTGRLMVTGLAGATITWTPILRAKFRGLS